MEYPEYFIYKYKFKVNNFVHVILQVWRWLFERKNDIDPSHRQELMKIAKDLIYSTSEEESQKIWKNFQRGSMSKTYPQYER